MFLRMIVLHVGYRFSRVFSFGCYVAMLHIIIKRENAVNQTKDRIVAFAMFSDGGISMIGAEHNHKGGSFDESKF